MVNKRIHRLPASTIITVALLLLAVRSTLAQAGYCPDYTTGINTPYSWWPGTMATCATNEEQETVVDGRIACESGVSFVTDWSITQQHGVLIVVPPAGLQYPSGRANVAFALFVDYVWSGGGDVPRVRLRSFSAAHQLIGSRELATPYDSYAQRSDLWQYYYATSSDPNNSAGAGPLPMVTGGYLSLEIVSPSASSMTDYFLSSLRVINSDYTIPSMCSGDPVPQPPMPTPTPTDQPPNTPTPTPTGTFEPPDTPTPTATRVPGTATPTPQTFPTSPATGYTPRPSSTPVVYPTRPVSMPTPLPGITWPLIDFPQINLPSINVPAVPEINPDGVQWPSLTWPDPYEYFPTTATLPAPTGIATITLPILATPALSLTLPQEPLTLTLDLTPNATVQARYGSIATVAADTVIAATRWHTVTNASLVELATGNTGITTTASTIETLASNLTLPIRYIKFTRIILPRMWIFISFLIIMFAWMTWLVIIKFFVHNGTKILEIIRRLIELIPGF